MDLGSDAAKRRRVVEWLNRLSPYADLDVDASDEELRARLLDGIVLIDILNWMNGGESETRNGAAFISPNQRSDNVERFVSFVEEIGVPGFSVSDLEQGYMSPVVESLMGLSALLNSPDSGEDDESANLGNQSRKRWDLRGNESVESMDASNGNHSYKGESMDASNGNHNYKGQNPVAFGGQGMSLPETKSQEAFWSPVKSEKSSPLSYHVGNKFHEVFKLKHGGYSDLSAAKISEMTKSNSLDKVPIQSLLSVVKTILDESIEMNDGEISQRVKYLLRKIVQEIERRILTQAEDIRNQTNLIKEREEKYQSRIKVLETLATGTSEETQIVASQLETIKTEKNNIEDKRKLSVLEVDRLMKENEDKDNIISDLKKELEMTVKTYDQQCQQLRSEAEQTKTRLEDKIKDVEFLLEESRKKTKELEEFSESKFENWNKKEHVFQNFIDIQLESVQELRMTSKSIKKQVLDSQTRWWEETKTFGSKLKVLVDAAENYHTVLGENRRLYNEVQELKGNIRVYCRIRPFLSGENRKSTSINYIGENGELLVENPSRPGKDGTKPFKFNKVYGPSASQEEVFLDIQPLIRSVLDGYNVCIFAYGQTGSGKTYTMSGPNSPTKENWGVNYRALNDLFVISRSRRSSFTYEVSVQMVEIYNEHVRDLLLTGNSQKKLGVAITSQPNGLAVPDASIHPVKSTSDVLQLMQFGQANRAMGSTALNERSSRSHSVLTVHVRGVELKTGLTSRGCLHLVDLAGSERVDRSEVTGDRLKETQHINRSLSALGDVIFALAQKSSHVPYRNSKLTQVLQSSLGGHAKTLMFVQINPSVESYSETVSTLKFAERVSGVELGAARSNKEGKSARDLMEQLASLKDTVARKDEEIEQLRHHKIIGIKSPNANSGRLGSKSLKNSSTSPRLLSGTILHGRRSVSGRMVKSTEKSASDPDNSSEFSDKHSETGSDHRSLDDLKQQKETPHQSIHDGQDTDRTFATDIELLGFGDGDSEERLSDISDSCLSMGTETDGSSSVIELSLFPEGSKPPESTENNMQKGQSQIPKLLPQKDDQTTVRSTPKDSVKSTSFRKSITPRTATTSTRLSKQRQ